MNALSCSQHYGRWQNLINVLYFIRYISADENLEFNIKIYILPLTTFLIFIAETNFFRFFLNKQFRGCFANENLTQEFIFNPVSWGVRHNDGQHI